MDLPSLPRPSLPDFDLSLRERLRGLFARGGDVPVEVAALDLSAGEEHLLELRAANTADGPVAIYSIYVRRVNGDTPLVQDEMAELTRIAPGGHDRFMVSFSGALEDENEIVLGIALEGPDGPATVDATVTAPAPDDADV